MPKSKKQSLDQCAMCIPFIDLSASTPLKQRVEISKEICAIMKKEIDDSNAKHSNKQKINIHSVMDIPVLGEAMVKAYFFDQHKHLVIIPDVPTANLIVSKISKLFDGTKVVYL